MQKKNYREEKKRATKELLSTITDPSVIVMADWLKVGTSHTLELDKKIRRQFLPAGSETVKQLNC